MYRLKTFTLSIEKRKVKILLIVNYTKENGFKNRRKFQERSAAGVYVGAGLAAGLLSSGGGALRRCGGCGSPQRSQVHHSSSRWTPCRQAVRGKNA